MPGDVDVYLYGCVSLLAPECAVYLCVYMCLWYQIIVPEKITLCVRPQ